MTYVKPELLAVHYRNDAECETGPGYNCENGGSPNGACVTGATA
jgi:hypothetical protein